MSIESKLTLPLLAIALLLWCVGAHGRTLWLDEFHSLHHASAETLAGVIERARADNHPPLSFLLVHLSRRAFGESHLALRLPSLLAGLLLVAAAWRLLRRRCDGVVTARTILLLVFSSYVLMIVTEARMYAWLAACGALLMLAMLRIAAGRPSYITLVLAATIGLYSHYDFLFYVAGAGVWLLGLALRSERRRAALGGLAALAVSAILFLPWALTGFRDQLAHELPPGSSHTSLRAFAESIGHLFFVNVGLGGAIFPWLALAGVLVALLLMIRGVLALWRRDRSLLFASLLFGIGVPLLILVVAKLHPRAAYNWRYIAGSVLPIFLITAAGADSRRRFPTILYVLLLICLAALTLNNALSRGRDDARSAVEYIVEVAEPEDTLLIAPTIVPRGQLTRMPWDYYLLRVEGGAGKLEQVEIRSSFDYENVTLRGKLLLMERGHGLGQVSQIKKRFKLQNTKVFGTDQRVHEFHAR